VLSNPTGAVIADWIGRASITDDDPPPSLSIAPAVQVVEGTSSKKVTIQISLSAASGQMVTVGFATANGTATAGLDYLATTGAITFTAGVTTRTITVTVLPDAINEGNERFTVLLSNPVNATIQAAQSVVTISNAP
jgi:hypothetical protein